jgi:hypothetical protein
LEPGQSVVIQTELEALRQAHASLLLLDSLEPLANIMSPEDMDEYRTSLDKASAAIAQKQEAQLILNTLVDVAVLVGQIAAKLA